MREQSPRDDFARLRNSNQIRTSQGPSRDSASLPSFVGQVVSSGSSIAVGHFLIVSPTSVLGVETEGGAGNLVIAGKSLIPVYLLGPGLPSMGDNLICRFVDHRWVTERTGGSGQGPGTGNIPYPGCACSVPPTLTMTSANSTCNFNMFQSCTIAYGPPPPGFSNMALGPKVWMSTKSFLDPIANSLFYYYLGCNYNQFYLTRLYATSPYGSPYRDATLYTWLVGSYGNTCVPFKLDNGSPFQGSDISCFVTIDDASL